MAIETRSHTTRAVTTVEMSPEHCDDPDRPHWTRSAHGIWSIASSSASSALGGDFDTIADNYIKVLGRKRKSPTAVTSRNFAEPADACKRKRVLEAPANHVRRWGTEPINLVRSLPGEQRSRGDADAVEHDECGNGKTMEK